MMLNGGGNSEDCRHGPDLEGNGSWPLSFMHSPFMLVVSFKNSAFFFS